MPNANYIEYNFTIAPIRPASEILIAELAEREFESFVEKENGLLAYIQKKDWYENILEGISILQNHDFRIEYSLREIEQQNWNATWEQNFEPIVVGNQCRVRAPFHEKQEFKYDIVIEPKMSFGTGHHETTRMMLQHILDNDFLGKTVLDMGCGTGVLAILTEMCGASKVDAIDIDPWSFRNTRENIRRNNCTKINVIKGDSSILGDKKYDVIMANINRNVLLQDIPFYATGLISGGLLFLSGYYFKDVPTIREKCIEHGLIFQSNLQEGDWVAAVFSKG